MHLMNGQPESSPLKLDIYRPALVTKSASCPLFTSKVPAGFPSPAEEHVEKRLDPSSYLIDHEEATFFVMIQGDSMIDAGLIPGDYAVVDKSREAVLGDIVVAILDGEYTIKYLRKRKDMPVLFPANNTGKHKPIVIKEGSDFSIWGVVTGSFRRFK